MKKGFTIVEIIISIGLIAVIGTVSIVSFNFIKKSNKEKILKNMSDEILTAVNVYIETNDEIKNELYNNKNGLKIPLTTLENSGLVDFNNIDVSDEYVVTMLGSTDADDDTCASTYTAKSWNFKNGETIYICEKSDGSSNLAVIDPTKYGNKAYVSNEPYYYRGYADNNYVGTISNFSCKKMLSDSRIYAIDMDDSIIVATKSSTTTNCEYNDKTYKIDERYLQKRLELIGVCSKTVVSGNDEETSCSEYEGWFGSSENLSYGFIVRLPNTCKITSGTGMQDNPFQITC